MRAEEQSRGLPPRDHLRVLLSQPDITQRQESLRQIDSLGTFFEVVGEHAVDILIANPQLLPENLDPDRTTRVLKNQDFSGTNPTDPDYDKLLGIVRIKEYIARSLIRRVVERENALGLSDVENIVLLGSLDIADHFDDLYWDWRHNVVVSPLAQRLAAMNKKKALEYLKGEGVLLDTEINGLHVVVVENEDGSIKAVPYAEAFADPIHAIGESINDMVGKLEGVKTNDDDETRERDSLVTYYSAFQRALTSTDPSEHETLYKEVDVAWMNVQGRMQPIHPIETYADPLGLRVEPDYALGFLDDRYKQINDQMVETKRQLIAYLSKTFAGKASLATSVIPMEASLAGIYTFLISGRRLESRPVGQNIPNREGVRIHNGVKIFIDTKTMYQRWQIQKGLLAKAFGQKFVAEVFTNEDEIVEVGTGVFVAGHEVGHNAFVQDGTRARIGPATHKQIEENKSDLVIEAAAPDFLTPAQQRAFIRSLLGMDIRALALKDNDSARPYYNGALVNLRIMEEVGMFQHSDGQWKFDDSPRKIGAFFGRVRDILFELVEVYETLDPEKGQDFIDKHYVESALVSDILNSLNP